jgi:hypothetical protein
MTRIYRAARRRSQKEPVTFDLHYEVPKEERDQESGEVMGVTYRQRTEHFVCGGEVSTLLLSELAYNADLDVADPEAMKLIRNFFANAFGDSEEGRKGYALFFRLVTRYGDDDLLMEIMAGMVEDFSGRPTKRPSQSPDTPSTTGETSKVVSLSRATVHQVVPGEVLEKETAGQPEQEQAPQNASSG